MTRESYTQMKLNECVFSCAFLSDASTTFFTSIRGENILIDGHDSNSKRLLIWVWVQSVDEDELILYFAYPKQATRENSQVCELFSLPDNLYCPIENLKKLAVMQRALSRTYLKTHVFTTLNGKILTIRGEWLTRQTSI